MAISGHSRHHDDVVVISGARVSRSQDHRHRVRQYLISMAIRTVSVVLLIVVPKPWGWVFLVTAVFLPYVAVVGGNARDQHGEGSVLGYHDPQKLLGPGKTTAESGPRPGTDPGSGPGARPGTTDEGPG